MYSKRQRFKYKNHENKAVDHLNLEEIIAVDRFVAENIEETDPLCELEDTNNNAQESGRSHVSENGESLNLMELEISNSKDVVDHSKSNDTRLEITLRSAAYNFNDCSKSASNFSSLEETWNGQRDTKPILIPRSNSTESDTDTIQSSSTDSLNKHNNYEIDIKQESDEDTDSSWIIKQEVDIFEEKLSYVNGCTNSEEIIEPKSKVIKTNVWICEFCDLKFKTNAALVIHSKVHKKNIKYDCAHCDLTYTSKSLLTKHIIIHKQFVCSVCKIKCFLEVSLNRHMKTHNVENLGDYQSIDIHVKDAEIIPSNDEDGGLKCRICNKQFSRRENLIFHIRTHVETKSFQCNICNKTLDDKDTLVYHIKTHAENMKKEKYIHCKVWEASVKQSKFDDHECNSKATSDQNSVLESDDWFTINERPFGCHLCGRSYKNRYSLRDHLKDNHGPRIVRTCEICNKSYLTKKSFLEHNLNVHPKVKKYQCDVCNKAFVARHLVARHMLKHTGEKKYQCEDCGKFFQMTYTLKLHRKIHLNDKSFQCYHCDKKFITKGNLQIHVKTHMKKTFA